MIAFAGIVLCASRAFAKPTIYVTVTIDPAEKRLREKMTRDLGLAQTPTTMEMFLAERFIETFSRLEMFNFVTANAPGARRLAIKVASKPTGLRYPREDVVLTLTLDGDPDAQQITIFQKCTCGMPPCAPENLSDAEWYRRVFRKAIQEWPQGLFKSIVLTRTARYEKGKVRTVEPIDEFGQLDKRPPSAVFEISYGESQRWFAMCRAFKVGRWNTLGYDQGNPQQFIAPACVASKVTDVPDGENGEVTLLRAFLR
ncbi:MAG TPA: hypothetical protein VL326_01710 [Kofleriaceae bacterium]|nr:hypothetical protein [Kofleriaceae bacterium]